MCKSDAGCLNVIFKSSLLHIYSHIISGLHLVIISLLWCFRTNMITFDFWVKNWWDQCGGREKNIQKVFFDQCYLCHLGSYSSGPKLKIYSTTSEKLSLKQTLYTHYCFAHFHLVKVNTSVFLQLTIKQYLCFYGQHIWSVYCNHYNNDLHS